jgi:hypothetical protein
MAAARCDGDRGVVLALHGGDRQFQIAPGVDELDAVADREAVLHLDLGQACGVVRDDIADIEAAIRLGMALQVALVFAIRMAFVEAAGESKGPCSNYFQRASLPRSISKTATFAMISQAGARHDGRVFSLTSHRAGSQGGWQRQIS